MTIGYVSHFKKGQHIFECSRCSFWFHSEHKRKEWDGTIVCGGPGTNDCFEVRHPQEFKRGIRDDQSVKDPRPPAERIFVAQCSRSAIVGLAVVGCAVVGSDMKPGY